MEDALKFKFLEGNATPLFRSRGTSKQKRPFENPRSATGYRLKYRD